MNIKVVIEQGEDGYFVARCPSLRSRWSQGRSWEEAVENIKQATALYLEPEQPEFFGAEDNERMER